jgi:hydroxymethylbilane synthase
MKIKIGTRKSKLAMWQAIFVRDALEKKGIESILMPIETKGDKVLDVSISKIGSKGVFTEELEEMLYSGAIDIAVHSAKDLPSELPGDFEILAFSAREKENDVLVSRNRQCKLDNKERALKIGTSSTRRIATLAHHFPHVETVDVRGNLQTRIKKMDNGLCDALLLAFAGVHRMGYHEMINQELPLNVFTPAVGQGSLAIEVSKELDEEKRFLVRAVINHQSTETKLLAERAYLRKLRGGCSIPAFANAQFSGDEIVLHAGIYSLDGRQLIQRSITGPVDEPEALGYDLGDKILHDGGAELLKDINEKLNRK